MKRFVSYISLIFITLLILARIHMAFVRYFDSDEFAHMHWAWLMANGSVPYRDFFYYITPYYQWLLTPVFLLPSSSVLLILARVWQLFIYLGSVILLYCLSKRIYAKSAIATLAVILFLIFPITFDKTIDIRPDMAMMLTYLGALFLICGKSTPRWKYLASGILVSVSFFILPKIVFAIPAYLYLLMVSRPKRNDFFIILTGLCVPAGIFSLYLMYHGVFLQAIQAIVHDSVLVNIGKIPFSPWKALSPWPLIYVHAAGPSLSWYTNTAIWIAAICGLIISTIKHPKITIFQWLFLGGGVFFLFAFPAPYTQYFLPLSIMASMLGSYALLFFFETSARLVRMPILASLLTLILFIPLSLSFWTQYTIRVDANANNDEQMSVVGDILRLSAPNEPVYDMIGSYVFRPDGYYICCHPYGEFIDVLRDPVGSLWESLQKTHTKFLILDRTGSSLWKPRPDDLAFLKSHFLSSPVNWKIYTLGVQFACNNGSCIQLDTEGKPLTTTNQSTFTLIEPETYRVTTQPPELALTINGANKTNTIMFYEAGSYSFQAAPSVTNWKIQMERP